MDEPAHEYISQIFKALSSKERIAALETFGKGKTSLMDLARIVGLSRSGFQNILDDFREARLIEQAEHRSYYRLTQAGRDVLELTKKFSEKFEIAEKKYRKEQLEQSISKFGSGLSKEEILEMIEKAEGGRKGDNEKS